MEHFPGLKTQLLSQPLVLYEYDDVRFWNHEMDSDQKFILTSISILVAGVGLLCNTIVPIVFAVKKKYYKSLNIFFIYINIVNSITLILASTRFLFQLNEISGWFVDSLPCKYMKKFYSVFNKNSVVREALISTTGSEASCRSSKLKYLILKIYVRASKFMI